MLTAIHPKRRVAKVLQAHYGGLHKTLKGDKMKTLEEFKWQMENLQAEIVTVYRNIVTIYSSNFDDYFDIDLFKHNFDLETRNFCYENKVLKVIK